MGGSTKTWRIKTNKFGPAVGFASGFPDATRDESEFWASGHGVAAPGRNHRQHLRGSVRFPRSEAD